MKTLSTVSRFSKQLIAAFLVLVLVLLAGWYFSTQFTQAAFYGSGNWDYRQKITIDSDQIDNANTAALDVRISQSSDDGEECLDTNDMYITSSDLEMVNETPGGSCDDVDQEVGMRFQNMTIPQGAVITDAYIEFETDETTSGTTNLTFHGQDIDNAATFTTNRGDITDRTKTATSVDWNNVPAWNTVDEKHQTPDISSVIQEIVDRGGWSSGNALAVIVTGSGVRKAEAYDGEAANAPLLHVEYETASTNDLSDFPVYVDLSDMQTGFFGNVQSDGADIRVTTADGTTEVPREVVAIDTGANTGELHFKADSLSASSDTEFYIYYGNGSATNYADSDTFGAENVWTNSFAAVYHLSEGFTDSTANANDGTANGGVTAGSGATKIGPSTNFDGADDFVDVGNFIDVNATTFTMSAWINAETIAGADQNTFLGNYASDSSTNQFRFEIDGEAQACPAATLRGDFNQSDRNICGSTGLSTSVWYHAALTHDPVADNAFIYLDGDQNGSDTAFATSGESPSSLKIGQRGNNSQWFDGPLDEVRVADVQRSNPWLAAEHTNQDTPTTFYTVGAQEIDVQPPTVTTDPATNITEDSATLNGEITSTGGENADERGFVYDTISYEDVYETGLATAVTGWTTVNLDGAYANPVVIVTGQESAAGGDAQEESRAVVRNIESSSFEVNNFDDAGLEVTEDIGYIVMESGHHTIDGVEVDAGTYTTAGSEVRVSWSEPFGSDAVTVVDTIQEETAHAYSSRYDENSIDSTGYDSSFWESWDESMGGNLDGGGFTAGYLAIRTDQGGSTFEGGKFLNCDADKDNNNWCSVSFANTYGSAPLLFKNPISNVGGDSTITGHNNLTTTGVDLRAVEGDAAEAEQAHADNDIPWIAWTAGAQEVNTPSGAPGSSSYSNSTTETGSFGTGTFSENLAGLDPDTDYYYRAYGHNSGGYSYGGEVSFTTDPLGTPFGGNPSGTYADTDWAYRQEITIQSSEVAENLTDFPVYIDLSDLGSSFFGNVNSDGSDIRVTAGDGTTELAREIVAVDTAGETGEIHFKADSLSATEDTSFYIYYGNPSAVDYADSQTYGTENVWTNGFDGVWHFEETPDQDGGTAEIKDSTGNANDGDTEGAMTAGDSQAGKLGGSSLSFDEVDDAVLVPDDPSLTRPGASDWEISGWMNAPDNTGSDFQYWLSWGGFLADPSYNLYVFEDSNSPPGEFAFRPSDSTPAADNINGGQLEANTWQYFSMQSDESDDRIRLFIDNNIIDSGPGLGEIDVADSLFFGSRSDRNADRYFGGRLDEWRLTRGHSREWTSTEHSNQNTPTSFYAVGGQETEEDAPGAGGGPATTSTRIRGGSDIRGGSRIR